MISLQVILYLLLFSYLYIIGYYIVGWNKLATFNPSDSMPRHPSVSIIIPVRNEELHIANLLNDIQAQTYPAEYIEIIVVDDSSTDNTINIIQSLNFPNVKVVPLILDEAINSYKKEAIAKGVASSTAELIITTDGDCRVGPEWISTIVDFYIQHNFQLISAPVSFHNESYWFEKIQTIEFQFLIGAAAACIENGMPNTCNGANLAYTRDVFNRVNGYDGIKDLASGDDEMLLQKIGSIYPNGIGFLKSEKAIVSTFAKYHLKDFIQQRIRWASKTSKYFNWRVMLMVVLIFLFNLSILIAIPFAVYFDSIKYYLEIALVFKMLFDGVFFYLTLSFFDKKKLLPYSILVEFFYTFYVVFIGLIGSSRTSYIWKNRKVR